MSSIWSSRAPPMVCRMLFGNRTLRLRTMGQHHCLSLGWAVFSRSRGLPWCVLGPPLAGNMTAKEVHIYFKYIAWALLVHSSTSACCAEQRSADVYLQLGVALHDKEAPVGRGELNTPNTAKAWDPSGIILTPAAQVSSGPPNGP